MRLSRSDLEQRINHTIILFKLSCTDLVFHSYAHSLGVSSSISGSVLSLTIYNTLLSGSAGVSMDSVGHGEVVDDQGLLHERRSLGLNDGCYLLSESDRE